MKTTILLLVIVHASIAQIPSVEVQIKTAVLAAPEDKRDGAMVYGYNSKGEFVVLRKGTNELVCLTDDPNSPGFNVSCYHKDLEPFMARGRACGHKESPFRKSLIHAKPKLSRVNW